MIESGEDDPRELWETAGVERARLVQFRRFSPKAQRNWIRGNHVDRCSWLLDGQISRSRFLRSPVRTERVCAECENVWEIGRVVGLWCGGRRCPSSSIELKVLEEEIKGNILCVIRTRSSRWGGLISPLSSPSPPSGWIRRLISYGFNCPRRDEKTLNSVKREISRAVYLESDKSFRLVKMRMWGECFDFERSGKPRRENRLINTY